MLLHPVLELVLGVDARRRVDGIIFERVEELDFADPLQALKASSTFFYAIIFLTLRNQHQSHIHHTTVKSQSIIILLH
jgi:hypothetical protein